MTTAHRPTFDPARGKEALRGPAYHQRLLPAHTQLKFRQPGQGGSADEGSVRDLRAELLAAEAAHFAKKNGGALPPAPSDSETAADTITSNSNSNSAKRPLAQLTSHADGDGDGEDPEAKRRRILEESRDIDADSDDDSDGGGGGSGGEDSEEDDDDDDDDDDDEDAELERELEKIRRERAEKRAKEEAEKAAKEQEERERDIAYGNPLLNPQQQNFNMKRRWDDDVVFKNQARGTENKGKTKEFINDLLRSDFHKRFMSKYVR
ncbi:complexed with cef1p [Diatrype stigma]|uniref:Complexed with cef1p n=1 Tax=Diatrype stigma TaxID=117547 RepID=A0AAN9UN70_9PEZI